MRVLVACEYSGAVRDAFRAMGHDAMSCDLLPTDVPGPHYQGSVLDVLDEDWDMMIAFPPCTHLAVSGARWFAAKRADGRQQMAIDFFMALANADIPKIAIENPVCIMSTQWRKPDQIIQPWPACGSRVCRSCAPATSWTDANNASGNCHPPRTAGRSEARHTKASPMRWHNSGGTSHEHLRTSSHA